MKDWSINPVAQTELVWPAPNPEAFQGKNFPPIHSERWALATKKAVMVTKSLLVCLLQLFESSPNK